MKITGILIGLGGALLCILTQKNDDLASDAFTGNLLCLLSSMAYAIYLIASNRILKHVGVMTMLRYTFSGAAFSAIIVSGFTGFEATLFTFPIHWKPMAVLAFVLIFPTVISYLLIPVGLKYLKTTLVAIYGYLILIVAAIVSGLLGETESAIVILVVITMNAILGTVQTVKAEQSLDSLKAMSGPEAKVFRNGDVIKVPSSEVTIGDIVMLEAGDYVPADGRILENASLKVDESALTGESLGVDKTEEEISGQDVPLGDRTNMVYSGSFVSYGRGSFLVTAIGMETEVGKIAKLLKSTSEKKTPLQMNLDNFGQKLSILILVFCAILFGISVFRGESIGDAFLFAVALAVAAIPEALSSIVTIVLSFGTQKMAKEHAIVRKLQAVEGLGLSLIHI